MAFKRAHPDTSVRALDWMGVESREAVNYGVIPIGEGLFQVTRITSVASGSQALVTRGLGEEEGLFDDLDTTGGRTTSATSCSCQSYAYIGLPCRHQIRVWLALGLGLETQMGHIEGVMFPLWRSGRLDRGGAAISDATVCRQATAGGGGVSSADGDVVAGEGRFEGVSSLELEHLIVEEVRRWCRVCTRAELVCLHAHVVGFEGVQPRPALGPGAVSNPLPSRKRRKSNGRTRNEGEA